MPLSSTIELTDLEIACDIGTYSQDDVVPRAHLLDLILTIDASLVLIEQDGMEFVFDYDPLLAEIDRLARDSHYDTQERLMTRIVDACAHYTEIIDLEVALRKTPVLDGTGELGVRLKVDADSLNARRLRP
ncbi:dihydroneopterin aldolase [Maricaulaceae bacterium NA33B04]|nr:dihydroneopterin aldolase [Maricaulaceae bacterium NA33B04]